MRRLVASLALIALASGAPAAAGARLRLIDGQVIEGSAVERKAELYVLELEGGDRLTIPLQLVAEVSLTGEDDPDVTAFVETQGRTLIGPPDGVELPRKDEQLEALGRPARFRKSVVESTWTPSSDWEMDPAKNNNWNPARWTTSPIDWKWTPRSVFRKSSDVTEFSPVRWAQSPIPYTWWPQDGFKR